MKKLLLTAVFAAAAFGGAFSAVAQPTTPRKVAVQTYTFRLFTLEETAEKLKDLGLDGIECYPGQLVSKSLPNVKMNPSMTPEQRQFVKDLLKKNNLKIVSFGVTSPKTAEEIEATCKFAKDMGIQRIITESPAESFPLWEKFCKENGVIMCIHHHARDSKNKYWDPQVLLSSIKGYDYIKASPDIGHWSRSNIKPIDGLQALKGNMRSMHFKDQKEFGNPKNQCVPLGEGQLDIKSVLAELDAQGYDGFFVIEYEADWEDNLPAVKKCVAYLRSN